MQNNTYILLLSYAGVGYQFRMSVVIGSLASHGYTEDAEAVCVTATTSKLVSSTQIY